MELTNPSHRSQLSRAINYLNLLKIPLKISISSQPGWQAGTIKVTEAVVTLDLPNVIFSFEIELNMRNSNIKELIFIGQY